MKTRINLGLAGSFALLLSACGGGADDMTAAAPAETPAPAPEAVAGDGDSQGDALVAGTNYNATAKVACAGYEGAAAGMCDAGVIRNGADGTTVEITVAPDTKRLVFFNPDGSFLSFGTAQADGTAAMAISSERKGDVTIARLGSETYEIPDVFVRGD